ncbi:MAG: flavin reductase family protein [Chloroflexi bacterium]|nr:flavin reductase family protein [Chloroflexota bacterium]
MTKVLLGPKTLTYPWPVFLVGANIDNRPNFTAISWCGNISGNPPTIVVGIRPARYTYGGIKQNLTFSVNLPPLGMMKKTDYCGLTSGSKVDKVKDCQFNVFYGKLGSAPLIEECSLNVECKVLHVLDLGSHSLIVGTVEETHVSEDCLTNGKPDIEKLRPFICTVGPVRQYQSVGRVIGEAWRSGWELQAK